MEYIIDGHKAVPCDNLLTWARWFGTADRHVAETQVGQVRVSTVFLGFDHRWDEGPPLLFETMIFGGVHNEYQTRCSTWDEAEEEHRKAVTLVETMPDAG